MDYYLQNPDRLEGQPKRTIADYVEQNRVLVPKRFSSMAEAKASGLPIIARSEHSQDYAGVSGILSSPILQQDGYKDIKSEKELKDKVLSKPKDGICLYEQFCKFSNYDENKFKAETSFSFWEILEGYNRTVVADTSIPNRYHVITSFDSKGKWFFNYAIIENGAVTQEFIKPLTPELNGGLPALIDFYENVRNLGRFDKNHCPIMEIQTVGNKNYFLQYHRARDFEPATFRLERDLEYGEVEALFVRGATSEKGAKYKTTVYYAEQEEYMKFDPQDEDGSWDLHWGYVFSELQTRQRKVQMVNIRGDICFGLMKFVVNHAQRSKLYKPQMSIIRCIDDFLFNGESVYDFDKKTKNGQNSHMILNVVSDGRKAFVKRLE